MIWPGTPSSSACTFSEILSVPSRTTALAIWPRRMTGRSLSERANSGEPAGTDWASSSVESPGVTFGQRFAQRQHVAAFADDAGVFEGLRRVRSGDAATQMSRQTWACTAVCQEPRISVAVAQLEADDEQRRDADGGQVEDFQRERLVRQHLRFPRDE